MNSGEVNKIAGGVIGALLIFLLIGFFSSLLYGVRGGHQEEDPILAFAVEVEEKAAGGGEAGPDWGALMAAVDASAGASLFNKCKSCHAMGSNGVGPDLAGIVGRKIASVSGYDYSPALSGKDSDWTLENLFGFLHNPKGWAPGTKMGFAGISKDQDNVNLIAWLNEQGPAPIELAAPEGAGGGDAAAGDGSGEAATTGEGSGEAATAEATGEMMPAEGEAATEETAVDGEAAAAAGAGMFASADAAAGEKAYKKCKACHQFGKNAVGPDLKGVIGRKIASVEGFAYSDALKGKEGAWNPDTLVAFIADPKGWAPGTKMTFAGVKKEADQANIVAYLNEQSDSPIDLGAGGGGGGEKAAESDTAAEETSAEGEAQAAATTEGSGETQAAAEGAEQAPAEGAEQTAPAAGEQQAAGTTEGSGEAETAEGEQQAAAGGAAVNGKKVFRKCRACHKLAEGENAVGPSLHGVVGREKASLDGFAYSDALKGLGGAWDDASLDGYLTNPKDYAPGTKMAFAGLSDEQDRSDVIAYLKENGAN